MSGQVNLHRYRKPASPWRGALVEAVVERVLFAVVVLLMAYGIYCVADQALGSIR